MQGNSTFGHDCGKSYRLDKLGGRLTVSETEISS
jgi:hypothetical protein